MRVAIGLFVTLAALGGVASAETPSIETASLFQDWRPDLRLFAETRGKNALIVTAMADRDQAIKDLVRSAFSHNGQKCSAAGSVASFHLGCIWGTISR